MRKRPNDKKYFDISCFSLRWPDKWAENDYPFMQYMLGESIKQSNETLYIKTLVSNLTFDGIDSPLLHMGDIDGDLGAAINNSIPFDKFGWFYSVGEKSLGYL